MDDDPIITIADMRRVFCVVGVKRWMEERGLDFRDFVRNGIPASELEAAGAGGLLDRVLKAKFEESGDG